jgi:hypothetical protein
MDTTPNKCPDCNGELERVELVDAVYRGMLVHGSEHISMLYAPLDSSEGVSAGVKDSKGMVVTFRCVSCCRIFFYGFPR